MLLSASITPTFHLVQSLTDQNWGYRWDQLAAPYGNCQQCNAVVTGLCRHCTLVQALVPGAYWALLHIINNFNQCGNNDTFLDVGGIPCLWTGKKDAG